MAAQAVYASHTLNIYITKADLDQGLVNGFVTASLVMAHTIIPDAELTVTLNYESVQALRMVANAERQAIVRAHALNRLPSGRPGGRPRKEKQHDPSE